MREIKITSGWNLPPGCFERDLPGNTAEDQAWDRFLDTEECAAVEGEGEEAMEKAFRAWYEDQIAGGDFDDWDEA